MFRINKTMQKKYSYAIVDTFEQTVHGLVEKPVISQIQPLEREISYVDQRRNTNNLKKTKPISWLVKLLCMSSLKDLGK